MLNAKLVVVGGDAKAGEFNLTLPTVIGRGKEAGLTIPHALVSRAHTEIFERDGRLVAKDLGSLNGTFINNTKIEGEQLLEPDQLLTLGNVTFRAVYNASAPLDSALTAGATLNDAGATLNDRSVAATLVAPRDNHDREMSPEPNLANDDTDAVFEHDTDSGSALSEIDSFEPDESDSFGRLSEINSKVYSAQLRTPVKPVVPPQPSEAPAASEPMEPGAKAEASSPPKPNRSEPQPIPNVGSTNVKSTNVDSTNIDSIDLGIETGQKDIESVSSIDGLPADDGPQVSFVGQIGSPSDTEDVVDSVKINLGDDHKTPAVDESRLGSFLKHLPK